MASSGNIDPEYASELARVLRLVAESHAGAQWSTNFNGEIRRLQFIATVAANQIERFADLTLTETPGDE